MVEKRGFRTIAESRILGKFEMVRRACDYGPRYQSKPGSEKPANYTKRI